MELWLILAVGSFIFMWCAGYSLLHSALLLRQRTPLAAGITLLLLFAGWIIVTLIIVPFITKYTQWAMVTTVYLISFVTAFCNADSWWRAINRFLPFD